MGTRFIFSLLLGFMLFYSQFVTAWEVSCPVFINIKSSTTVLEPDISASWQRSSRYEPRLWLDGVGMSQGKPENRVDLKPETETIKGETRQIWDTTMASNQNSERYWVSCIYGLVITTGPCIGDTVPGIFFAGAAGTRRVIGICDM